MNDELDLQNKVPLASEFAFATTIKTNTTHKFNCDHDNGGTLRI